MSILSFQIPERVVMEKANDFHGLFTFKPLEIGYGVTIGNALRRILLSSLEGYAVTAVKVSSVQHEFSTIKGVVEDMSEIILNLKLLRFKKISDVKDEKIIIQVSGQEEFRGSDVAKFTQQFEVLNPELLIFTCDKSVNIEIELLVNKGRGYLPAEESTIPTETIGLIPIDSIFTPIKNVKYVVENTRVKQKTDYEQLILDIETDGSIHPENALKEAANILIKHFMLFSDKSIILETEKEKENAEVDEEILKKRKLLKTPLNDLDLSVRAYNCLKAADVKTLGDLAQLEISDMMKFRNFGKKSLSELEELIAEKNLTFGIDTSIYKLEEE